MLPTMFGAGKGGKRRLHPQEWVQEENLQAGLRGNGGSVGMIAGWRFRRVDPFAKIIKEQDTFIHARSKSSRDRG